MELMSATIRGVRNLCLVDSEENLLTLFFLSERSIELIPLWIIFTSIDYGISQLWSEKKIPFSSR